LEHNLLILLPPEKTFKHSFCSYAPFWHVQGSVVRLKGHGGNSLRWWWVSKSFEDLEGDKARARHF
jgi:hypothetical protein